MSVLAFSAQALQLASGILVASGRRLALERVLTICSERIDANTEDVVDNVGGAQRELLKYWSRASSNRWLIAKMFGVLMIFFL